jgi:hypothetical protein
MVTMDCDALEQVPALPDDDDLVGSAAVKKENGNVSGMTLWRWQRDERVQFPAPDLVINGRNYWKRRTLRQHRHRMEMESRLIARRP